MKKHAHRRWVFGLVATMAVMIPASVAFACVGLISLTTTGQTVQPGGSVTLVGREFAQGVPVEIHLDSSTGPLLTTAPAPTTTMTSQFNVQVPIPLGTPSGQHVLIATQDYHNMNSGAPARAVIYVGTPAPSGATPSAARPKTLVTDTGLGSGSLLLIALGVAAAGLLVAGLWYGVASKQKPAQPAPVKAS